MATLYNEILLAKIDPETLKEPDIVYIIGDDWFDIAHVKINSSGEQLCLGDYGNYTFKNGTARSSVLCNPYHIMLNVYGIVPGTGLEPMLCSKAIPSDTEPYWKMTVQKLTPKDILVDDFHIDNYNDGIVQLTNVQYNATTLLYTVEFLDRYGGRHNEMIYRPDEQLTIVRLYPLGG